MEREGYGLARKTALLLGKATSQPETVDGADVYVEPAADNRPRLGRRHMEWEEDGIQWHIYGFSPGQWPSIDRNPDPDISSLAVVGAVAEPDPIYEKPPGTRRNEARYFIPDDYNPDWNSADSLEDHEPVVSSTKATASRRDQEQELADELLQLAQENAKAFLEPPRA